MAVSLQKMWKNDGKWSFHYNKCGIYHGLPSKLEGFTTIIMDIYHDVRKKHGWFHDISKKKYESSMDLQAPKKPQVSPRALVHRFLDRSPGFRSQTDWNWKLLSKMLSHMCWVNHDYITLW